MSEANSMNLPASANRFIHFGTCKLACAVRLDWTVRRVHSEAATLSLHHIQQTNKVLFIWYTQTLKLDIEPVLAFLWIHTFRLRLFVLCCLFVYSFVRQFRYGNKGFYLLFAWRWLFSAQQQTCSCYLVCNVSLWQKSFVLFWLRKACGLWPVTTPLI